MDATVPLNNPILLGFYKINLLYSRLRLIGIRLIGTLRLMWTAQYTTKGKGLIHKSFNHWITEHLNILNKNSALFVF